ncbi:MAG: hypothetical protein HZB51_12700 [Chloroflexi bacterium]|nr:hypothetical protein [Chloroflexota bacterium]
MPAELRPRHADFQSTPVTLEQPRSFKFLAFLLIALFVLGGLGIVIVLTNSASSSDKPIAKAPVATPTPVGVARVVLTFGGEGTAPGLFQDARHIAVDSNGNMFVDDRGTMRIQKFDANGKYVSGWTVDQSLCSNKSATLNTLAADRSGNVFVHYCGSILKYDGTTGKLLAQLNGDKNSPRDFYLDMMLYPDGNLLVLASGSPSANEVLLRLDANGKVLARYPNPVSSQSNRHTLALTLKPAMDGLGNIFLLNNDDDAIYKFTADGKYVNRFGSVGTGAGQFDTSANHIAVDNQSRVYVMDWAGIKVFDSNGAFVDSMSTKSIGGGVMEMRMTDKNEVYVVANKSMIYKLVMNNP